MMHLDAVLMRARAINVLPAGLARMAGVSQSRITRGARLTVATLERLNAALMAEESRFARHLESVKGNGASRSAGEHE